MKRKEPKYKYGLVMLIDDSELDNFINEKMIQASHFAKRIYVNSSGVSALEFLKNLCVSGLDTGAIFPEVVFIDINMPIMDGFQFLERLKTIDNLALKKMKLVVLTSSAYEEDMNKAQLISPGIRFYHKPLTDEMLDEI